MAAIGCLAALPRRGLALVTVEDQLFAIGGYTEKPALPTSWSAMTAHP